MTRPQRRIDAILFDLDDTLMPEIASEREALLATCAQAASFGVDAEALAHALIERAGELWGSWGKADYYRSIGYSRWEGLWGPYDDGDPGLGDLSQRLPDYRQRAWDAALDDHGVRDTALRDELIDRYRHEREQRMAPFPDTLAALESARSRYRLALVTNGAPAVQKRKIERAGLGDWFDFVSISGEVGAAKPDPRPFVAALEALGIEPGNAMMVGNSQKADIAGAKNLGMFAVWINRDGDAPGTAEPDAEIRTLDELAALL